MLARIRKAQEENEGGFTLIELLVVMIIIGILAAIAIPVFLNQRKSGYDAGAKSDVRNAATAEETYYTDNQDYTSASASLPGWKQSAHTTGFSAAPYRTDGAAVDATHPADSYKIAGYSESGKEFCWDSANSNKGVYAATALAASAAATDATADC
jgi:type IV pilus assembly protein PilA